jgi:hypothetical protein
MKTLASLVALALLAVPASAHPQKLTDPKGDVHERDDPDSDGMKPITDLAGARFEESKRHYSIVVKTHRAMDVERFCPPGICPADASDEGSIDVDLYVKNDSGEMVHYYYVNIANSDGELKAGLYRLKPGSGDYSKVGPAKLKVADKGRTFKLTVARRLLEGHRKGRKLFWNVNSRWFRDPASSDECVYDSGEAFNNACVDFVPTRKDAEHRLKK